MVTLSSRGNPWWGDVISLHLSVFEAGFNEQPKSLYTATCESDHTVIMIFNSYHYHFLRLDWTSPTIIRWSWTIMMIFKQDAQNFLWGHVTLPCDGQLLQSLWFFDAFPELNCNFHSVVNVYIYNLLQSIWLIWATTLEHNQEISKGVLNRLGSKWPL